MKTNYYEIIKHTMMFVLLCLLILFIVGIETSELTIADKISKETYIDEKGNFNRGEWLWNLGEFVAIFVSFGYLSDCIDNLFKNRRKGVGK